MCLPFFSSRRRHTRLQGDWSSDVCSSDLDQGGKLRPDHRRSSRSTRPRSRPTEGTYLRSGQPDRKSTRLNSSHLVISYAVFCLKKKINNSLDRTMKVTYSYMA